MQKFTNQDIIDYYDNTEVHYRMYWKFKETLCLHYAIYEPGIWRLADAILNTNTRLAKLGQLSPTDVVLDAGCGVGGSAIFLAKKYNCKVTGVTLSAKQVATATRCAKERGVAHLTDFITMDYNFTNFPDATFDVIWGIESIETTLDKATFFREAKRILKPGGRILIGDYFKPYEYNIDDEKQMAIMLNGWAISDTVTLDAMSGTAKNFGFQLTKEDDVNKNVSRAVRRIFLIGFPGMYGTFLYNTFIKKTSFFPRNHYRTCFAQYFAYKKNLWRYKLLVFTKDTAS